MARLAIESAALDGIWQFNSLAYRAKLQWSCAARKGSAKAWPPRSMAACLAVTSATSCTPSTWSATSIVHLQQCSVLFADEAFFAGDRSHESTLKALITEETLLVEPKGVERLCGQELHSISLCLPTAAWVIPASTDARRGFFMLNVSDTRKQDTRYFGAIIQEMENGGREALLHHLLNLDLMGFQRRQVPQTGALASRRHLPGEGSSR